MPVIRRQALTKAQVESVKPNKSKDYRLWDAKVPGLALRVLTSGRGTFEVHWGRNKSVALGTNGAMSLEGARTAARRVLGEVSDYGAPLSLVPQEGSMTFGDFLSDRYGPHIEATNKAGHATVAALKAQFSQLNGKKLSEITTADFDDFKAQRLRDKVRPATINRDMDRLKAALSQAVAWGLLGKNPLLGMKRITRGIEERVRYLTPGEEKALRSALDDRESKAVRRRKSGNAWRARRDQPLLDEIVGYSDYLMPMTLLALNTGMRRGELTQLTWDDVNLSSKLVTVRAGYAKSGKARHIPLNAEAVQVLKTHRKGHRGKGLLFDVVSVAKSWNALMEAAKLENFRFHDLRHTFASNLVMAGVDLNSVRELLGHFDIKMTLRYAHLAPEHKAAAVETLVARRSTASTVKRKPGTLGK